jgi:hypothetical protein
MSRSMILLGAGASAEAGIPTAISMTQSFLDAINPNHEDRSTDRAYLAFSFIINGVRIYNSTKGSSPYAGVNIEEVVNALDDIINRNLSESSFFIQSWHPYIDYLENIAKEQAVSGMANELNNIINHLLDRNNYDRSFIKSSARPPSYNPQSRIADRSFQGKNGYDDALFSRLRSGIVRYVTQKTLLTNEDINRLSYLIPLVQWASSSASIISTLNYDNSIELVAKHNDIKIDTGISKWNSSRITHWKKSNIPLIKLHGSANWSAEKNKDDINIIDRHEELSIYGPSIIFGGRNKLTSDGPFLHLMMDFWGKISQCDRLFVIGYSFSDTHINSIIFRWLRTDQSREISIANGPGFGDMPYLNQFESPELMRKIINMKVISPLTASAFIQQNFC